jgi:hypothetical protein
MKPKRVEALRICLLLGLVVTGCGESDKDPNAGAPPPLRVEQANDRNVFQVEHPEQFPLVAAVEHFCRAAAEGHRRDRA